MSRERFTALVSDLANVNLYLTAFGLVCRSVQEQSRTICRDCMFDCRLELNSYGMLMSRLALSGTMTETKVSENPERCVYLHSKGKSRGREVALIRQKRERGEND